MRTTTRRAQSAYDDTVHAPPPAVVTRAERGAGAPVDGVGREPRVDAAPEYAPRGGALALSAATTFAVAAAAVAWMLALYRPWESAPFSIIDFSEFLPILKAHATFGDRLRALVTYYASQGRFNPLPYAALAAKWSVFGDSPVAWQWLRAAQMVGIFVGVVTVLRELRFRWLATVCGAGLFVTGAPVVSAWTRLTMGEPLAVCFMLAATVLALRYQRATRWRAYAAAIGVSLLGVLLSKEMLVFVTPLLLLAGWLYRGDGRWLGVPERSRRNVVLLLWLAAVVALVGAATVFTLLHSRAGSFASGYGSSRVSALWAIRVLGFFALPFSNGTAAGPENLLYAAVVGGGLYASWKRRRLRLAPWVTAASLPVLAALLYVPWPGLLDFYQLPSLLGSALLLALAVESLAEVGRPAAVLAGVACLAMLGSSSRYAYTSAQMQLAGRHVDGEVARLLGTMPPGYPAVLALRPEMINRRPDMQWMMHGPTLSRYAAAVSGHPVPLAVEVTCGEAEELLRVGKPAVVTYNGGCAFSGPPIIGVRARFSYWDGLRRGQATLGADIVWPWPLRGSATAR